MHKPFSAQFDKYRHYQFFFKIYLLLTAPHSIQDFSSPTGIQVVSPAVEGWSLNPWMPGKSLSGSYYLPWEVNDPQQ